MYGISVCFFTQIPYVWYFCMFFWHKYHMYGIPVWFFGTNTICMVFLYCFLAQIPYVWFCCMVFWHKYHMYGISVWFFWHKYHMYGISVWFFGTNTICMVFL